jgi:two-component system chemotaxis response regulator CheB
MRILVVDDSALYRTLVRNVLRDIPGVEVVGVAIDGKDALAKLDQFQPDLLTLDVQMPESNGLEVLRAMKGRKSRARAIMLSSLTSQGAQTTTDALLAGAFDFIHKPSSTDAKANRDALHRQLTEKLSILMASQSQLPPAAALTRAIANASTKASTNATPAPPAIPNSPEIATKAERIDAVVIGTSTGGPVALREVIPKLPGELGVPVFVVQHMPPGYTHSLAQRICEASQLQVIEGAMGQEARPNTVYIAPGGKHLQLVRTGERVRIETNEDPPEHNCRPAVDVLFRSAASAYEGHVLAVVLTGMGRDGAEGCRAIKRRGGTVFAQHPDGCVVYGMPKAVIDEQLADRVIPLDRIASWIVREVQK